MFVTIGLIRLIATLNVTAQALTLLWEPVGLTINFAGVNRHTDKVYSFQSYVGSHDYVTVLLFEVRMA
jgi:hypothetical protein